MTTLVPMTKIKKKESSDHSWHQELTNPRIYITLTLPRNWSTIARACATFVGRKKIWNVLVELDAAKLISPIVHDLHTGGATPVVAIERALEAHIFQCFQNSLVSRLIKPPRVRLHESYFKERFANLKSLAKSGYETWYTEVCCATAAGDKIEGLEVSAEGIDLLGELAEFGKNRTLRFSGHP